MFVQANLLVLLLTSNIRSSKPGRSSNTVSIRNIRPSKTVIANNVYSRKPVYSNVFNLFFLAIIILLTKLSKKIFHVVHFT